MRTNGILMCAMIPVLIMAMTPTASRGGGDVGTNLRPMDVFELEYASDPRISADGKSVIYVRNFMDIMSDTRRSNLWSVRIDGTRHRAITTGSANHTSPRLSPDGQRLAYLAEEDGSAQLYVRWLDTGQVARLTQLQRRPSGVVWSPDGRWIAFSMLVPKPAEPFVPEPDKPKGATWAEPPRVIRDLFYRADGAGYLESGYEHWFVVSAEGGTPRQVTSGDFHHRGRACWSPDGRSLILAANRHDNWEYEPRNYEVLEVIIVDGSIRALTDRDGPDGSPTVSPDGKRIAYTGFDDRRVAHQVRMLYVMDRAGTNTRSLTESLDRDVSDPVWNAAGTGLYFQYDDRGDTKIAFVTLDGKRRDVADGVGGLSLGRPYSGGSFTLADGGSFAFTRTTPQRPADVFIGQPGQPSRRLTALNEDLFAMRKLAEVEEFLFASSYDDRKIQGWIVKPPGFDPARKYPLILEIHGGPVANYGSRFAAEMQLYAAAGYVVLYINPRGSSGYGEAFGNLIHHNYPGQDYDDLMSGVDAVIQRGYVDAKRLYVTGGSGGGVLTSWIVGKTDRFRAAVVAKPVINWTSFVLTADMYTFFHQYWFPDYPWNAQEEYWRRSPLSLVGHVTTPTMLLTGEDDHRTPIAESEQYYQALKLRRVETVLVRIPGASHHIAARPSHLIAKVAHVLKWFDDHGGTIR